MKKLAILGAFMFVAPISIMLVYIILTEGFDIQLGLGLTFSCIMPLVIITAILSPVGFILMIVGMIMDFVEGASRNANRRRPPRERYAYPPSREPQQLHSVPEKEGVVKEEPKKKRTALLQIECPSCKHEFKIEKGQVEIKCPGCGLEGEI
jgi:DNA-directed RNA polymerase subunit RPC12/RpoP